MHSIFKYLVVFTLCFVMSTCKKYDDGGFVKQTRLHLFGGHRSGDHKTWKLKKYEVNGIDSTDLIKGPDNIPDFYSNFFVITYTKSDPSPEFIASTFLFNYTGTIDLVYKKININMDHYPLNKTDSSQCSQLNGINYCLRNIFVPEIKNKINSWDIKKLTKHEFIIEASFTNKYKIILTH
jgi:hypothetical protein